MKQRTRSHRIMLQRAVPGLVALLLLQGCETLSSIAPWTGKSEDLHVKVDPGTKSVEELYNNGVDALTQKRYATAVSQFDAVEQNYPYSSWAVNAQLMHGYAEYLQNHYTEAIGSLDRFIQLHPTSPNASYAYYLRGLSFYEQIADIQRDQKGTQQAMVALQDVVNRFPESAYARDARLKIDLCRDHMAGKEMEIGRFYEQQKLYGSAIGRFQRVVDDYQTTNHAPEALHRLTEIYLMLGMADQAKKTAAVLGHNYPGSRWYEDSYGQLADDGMVSAPGTATATAAPTGGFFARTLGSLF